MTLEAGVATWRSVVAVPSVHFHPWFAQQVRRVFRGARPSVVAVEMPERYRREVTWALRCWPTPVASLDRHGFWPFVPGDSVLEACRLAAEHGVPIECVDLDHGPVDRRPFPCVDPGFASRGGDPYQAVQDALQAAAGAPASTDLHREAYMAWRLAGLVEQYERVLWVGGLAHWTRMRGLLERGGLADPGRLPHRRGGRLRRVRLEPGLLHAVSGRLPWLVREYAFDPDQEQDLAHLQKLVSRAAGRDPLSTLDVVAMLRYARNLAARRGLRETPDLDELVAAATSCISDECASRLRRVAMVIEVPYTLAALPRLGLRFRRLRDGRFRGRLWLEGRPLASVPVIGRPIELMRPRTVLRRRSRSTVRASVAAPRAGAPKRWVADPDEEHAYERYVQRVLARAVEVDEGRAVPFQTGLGDGIDVRATIRHAHDPDGPVYVREATRRAGSVRNGLIDYSSTREDSDVLRGRGSPAGDRAGWIDPSLRTVGSASRQVHSGERIQATPFEVYRNRRELSLVTLDAPTLGRTEERERRSFYTRVICRLIKLRGAEDDLYGWLRVMFDFCRDKPFAYFSRYVPGPRVHRIAREFGVRVLHVPLERIPAALRERNQAFDFMWLTKEQYAEYEARLLDARRSVMRHADRPSSR